MKKFKTKLIDLKKMSNIRGGDTKITFKDLSLAYTKKALVIANEDTVVEVSGTITVEK
jgi:hypothetical protein